MAQSRRLKIRSIVESTSILSVFATVRFSKHALYFHEGKEKMPVKAVQIGVMIIENLFMFHFQLLKTF